MRAEGSGGLRQAVGAERLSAKEPGNRMTSTTRAILALAAASLTVVAAVSLARVDTSLGNAFGPDRRMRLLDASAADYPGRDAIARAVLADRPVDGRAYRALATSHAAAGQHTQSRALLDIAVRRWPRDPMTRALLADQALAAGDADTGLEHLDALLRVAPHTRGDILPLLIPHLGDTRVREALVARLALDPPWRNALATTLRADTATPAEVEALLAALATRVPLAQAELRTRIAALDRGGQPARARALWLSTLDPLARGYDGLLYDGGFEAPPSGDGYGWHLAIAPGAHVDFDPVAPHAGAYSLVLQFSGRAVPFIGVSQALVLPPGRYRFEAAARDDTGSARPFEWRIACTDGAVLAAVPIDARGAWRAQSASFEVPPGCPRQAIALRHTSRSLAERQLQGSLHIDALGIFPGR